MGIASLRAWLAVGAMAVLAGCATPPQGPIALEANRLNGSSGKVGVAMSAVPAADTHLPGAGCLLCLAAASLANSSLTSHAKTLPSKDLASIQADVVEALRRKGVDVVVISDPIKIEDLPKNTSTAPNAARQDFSALKAKYGLDRLVMIDVTQQGFERTYSSYIPTSDPKGLVRGSAYLVNLGTQTYEWYTTINVVKATDKKWDEPPQFPGLTNAYYQAVEAARDTVVTPLVN
jgi:hypothetical protein